MYHRTIIVLSLCAAFIGTPMMLRAAGDSPDAAKKLVMKVPADSKHQHLDFYTGKHPFMNDADLSSLKKGLYLMSWLVLDPPIILAAGGGVASMGKDLLSDYAGMSETSLTMKNTKNFPVAGAKAKKAGEGIAKNGMWWIPMNFQDVADAGQGGLFASGNEFDWLEWGGQGLNQFHEYLFCLVKWDKGGKIAFKCGSDDPETTWVNGELVTQGLLDRDWGMDADPGEATVPAGEWVPILAELGENGGEAGYTLRVEPAPDDHTLDIEGALAVSPSGKASVTWGWIKSAR